MNLLGLTLLICAIFFADETLGQVSQIIRFQFFSPLLLFVPKHSPPRGPFWSTECRWPVLLLQFGGRPSSISLRLEGGWLILWWFSKHYIYLLIYLGHLRRSGRIDNGYGGEQRDLNRLNQGPGRQPGYFNQKWNFIGSFSSMDGLWINCPLFVNIHRTSF